MMYITGDTHGDWRKLNKESFPEQDDMTINDYLLILGDFGIWDNSKREKWWFDWMEKKNFTILFVDGNHENFDILNSLPVSTWHGGNVHFIRKNIIHLMRGQVFDIDNKKFFTFGGARSHDITDGILNRNDINFKEKKKNLNRKGGLYRINHETWWEEEMPSANEMQEGNFNLDINDRKVNYIITHECPGKLYPLIDFSDEYKTDELTDYFDNISQTTNFNLWLFGHHHIDKKITQKFICLYDQIVKLY